MRTLIYLLIIFSLGSCMSQEKCLKKFPPSSTSSSSTKVIIRDSIIPGATVTKIVREDSLVQLPGEIRTYIDTSGKAELTFFRNAYGELVISCVAKDQTIKSLQKEVLESKNESQVHELEVRYIPFWLWILIGVLGVISLPSLFRILKFIS